MVRLLVVMKCGTKIYKTKEFKNKIDFKERMNAFIVGYDGLLSFTDIYGTFVMLSPTNCLIECEDCEE